MLTCGVWVKRGIAKEEPDRVALTEEDLKQILEETGEKIKDAEETSDAENCDSGNDDNEDDNDELADTKQDLEESMEPSNDDDDDDDDDDEAIVKEYGLDGYDEEGALMTGAGMAGLMYFNSNDEDPYVSLKDVDADDEEDFLIKKDDNLFVVGKMEEDFSCLEIYVYNEDEDSLYVHHDIILESFPLCLEWLSYDPCLEGKSGNFVAVGTMEPDIQIWDLDLVDAIEPAFVLAGTKKKKKKKKNMVKEGTIKGHTDAVLGISWNNNAKTVLASASADQTVLLWDMSQCKCVHSLKHHKNKVQAVRWHPFEAQSLLTGSFDKTAAVLDCRSPEVFKSWALTGDCEQVLWDSFSPYNFFVSSDDGVVFYFDVRTDEPVFTLHAHDEAVTGLSLSHEVPGCLTTVSADKILKVWDYQENKPQCVMSRDMKMGSMNFVTSCPDIPLAYAVGGEKDGVRVLNLMDTNQGKQHFQSRSKLKATSSDKKDNIKTKEQLATMETDATAADALASLSLKTHSVADTSKSNSNNTNNEIVKRKKKKKKK